MDQKKLTKRLVDASEPQAERYTIFDTVFPGFGLCVFPSGAKSWIFEYRPGEGGRRVANKHTPFQANRILAVIGSKYGFGSKHGLVPEDMNPARGIERYREDGRERYLSVEELERLGAAIREAETSGIPWKVDPRKKTKHTPQQARATKIGEHAAAALRLLIFTGARIGEILNLKWEHVDLERGLLLLPDSKTGKKRLSSTLRHSLC